MEDRTVLSTLTVMNINDSGLGSLRQAILDANSNGSTTNTINFAPALAGKTITLTSGELDITKSVNIVGSSETISGNNSFRVFKFDSGTNKISGLIIANANSTSSSLGGGGILNNGANLTVSSVTLTHNSAVFGGGLENADGGTLNVLGSTISNNSATDSSGGLDNFDLAVATVSSSSISGNSATNNGGGIGNFVGSTLTVNGSTISNNSATNGGGIYNSTSAVTVNGSVVAGNTASTEGGGIDNPTGTVTLNNSVVAGNTAPTDPDINGPFTAHHSIVGGVFYP